MCMTQSMSQRRINHCFVSQDRRGAHLNIHMNVHEQTGLLFIGETMISWIKRAWLRPEADASKRPAGSLSKVSAAIDAAALEDVPAHPADADTVRTATCEPELGEGTVATMKSA